MVWNAFLVGACGQFPGILGYISVNEDELGEYHSTFKFFLAHMQQVYYSAYLLLYKTDKQLLTNK